MAENLRYVTSNSLAAAGERFYEWNEANTIAPNGWHIPSDVEWQQLELQLGMSATVVGSQGYRGTDQADKMKIGGSSGLNLTYTGHWGYSSSVLQHLDNGIAGKFWSSTKPSSNIATFRGISTAFPGKVYRANFDVTGFYCSVRCVKN